MNVYEPQVSKPHDISSSMEVDKEGNIPRDGAEGSPTSLGDDATCKPRPALVYPEEKTTNVLTDPNFILCPIEEELAVLSDCGDSAYWHCENQTLRNSEETSKEHSDQVDSVTLVQLKFHAEIPLVTDCTHEMSHHLACTKRIGDCTEPKVLSMRELNSLSITDLPSASLKEHILLMSPNSTINLTEVHAQTTSTVGICWSQFDVTDGESEFERQDDSGTDRPVSFRPKSALQFSPPNSNPFSEPQQPSPDSKNIDPNVGMTSTTQELRWTPLEQETLDATELDAAIPSPSKMQFADIAIRVSTDVQSAPNSPIASLTQRDGMLRTIKSKSLMVLTDLVEEYHQNYHDHSMVLSIDRDSNEGNQFPEMSARPFTWAPLVGHETPNTNPKASTMSESTALPSNLYQTPICRLSHSYSTLLNVPRQELCTDRTSGETFTPERFSSTGLAPTEVDTTSPSVVQTFEKLIEGQGLRLCSCATYTPGPVSKARSLHIKTNQTKLTPKPTSPIKFKYGLRKETPLSRKLQSQILASNRLQSLKNSTLFRYEPFEKLETERGDKWKRYDSAKNEINRIEELDLNKLDAEQDNQNFECQYVEISLCRNLAGVEQPSKLSEADARAVHTLVSKQLRNAIVTQLFLHSTHSKSSERESSGSVEDDTTSHKETYNTTRRYNIPIGNTYRYRSLRVPFKRRRSCSGAYVFAEGPKQSKPPTQWMIGQESKDASQMIRSVSAWKDEENQVHLGGLINFAYHLQVMVSAQDGRIGSVYQQATQFDTKLFRKGTNYVNRPTGDTAGDTTAPTDSIRLFIHAPTLTRLASTKVLDMSPSVGLGSTGISLKVCTQDAWGQQPQSEIISLTMKTDSGMITPEHINHLVGCLRYLRALQRELDRTQSKLRCHVMPIETEDYLIEQIYHGSSYTKYLLTESVTESVQGLMTIHQGTLSHCIRPNAYCWWEMLPWACDPDAYRVFRPLYYPIFRTLCHIHNAQSQPSTCSFELPDKESLKISPANVLSYQVCFCRNLEGFGFPPVMSPADYSAVERLCKSALMSWKEEGLGSWYILSELEQQNPKLYASLQRKHLIMEQPDDAGKVFGHARFWPHGRSIYMAPDRGKNCDLVVHINRGDHLRVISVDWTGKHAYRAYNRAVKLMTWLHSKLRFSKDPNWGYLSPMPTNVGTGMKISCLYRAPAKAKDTVNFVKNVCDLSKLKIESINSQGVPVLYHHFRIGCSSTIGLTEAALAIGFLQSMQKLTEAYWNYVKE